MKKIYLIILSVAVFSLLAGYVAGRSYKTYELTNKNPEDHSTMHGENHKEMEHPHISVAPNRINPKIQIRAEKDSMGGYNLYINTSAFTFTPQMAGKASVQNTGHAHVFINGEKVARAYGNWFYLGDSLFKNGTNTISVELNSNQHESWVAKDGQEIKDTIEIIK